MRQTITTTKILSNIKSCFYIFYTIHNTEDKSEPIDGNLESIVTSENLIINDDVPLEVVNIDYMIRDNCYEHWTDSFAITNTIDNDDSNEKAKLVVRRGQTFKLKITFTRAIRKEDDVINLTFTLANATQKLNYQTHIVTPVLEEHLIVGLASESAWHSRLSSIDNATAAVSVTPSAKAVVGEWSIDVDTRSKKDTHLERSISKHTAKKNIFILFNPWCKRKS